MIVQIENWSVIRSDPYIAPEAGILRLHGNVFGHPKFPDGHEIQTSPIVGYDLITDEIICKSRRYKLGQVDPKYEEMFPDAKKKLIGFWSQSAKSQS